MKASRYQGFTLIEVVATVAIVGILVALALPSYRSYVLRARVPPALDGLSSYFTRMEQRYQDVGNYGSTTCSMAVPTVNNFTMSCVITNSGQGFTATATGSGTLNGYAYTINHLGARNTTAHPKGVPSTACWSMKGVVCDT